MNPTTANDMVLDSDYPMDKIIGYSTGSNVVPALNFNDLTLTHNFPFAPLYYLRWSLSPTFATSFEETGRISTDFLIAGEMSVNTAKIYMTNNTSTSATIYYRLILFAPYDINATSDQTQLFLDDYNINTDYNYPKIYLEGYINDPGGTINHNLGYIPQVDAWFFATNGKVTRFMGSRMPTTSADYKLLVTTNTLVYIRDPSLPSFTPKLYYRIYLDSI